MKGETTVENKNQSLKVLIEVINTNKFLPAKDTIKGACFIWLQS